MIRVLALMISAATASGVAIAAPQRSNIEEYSYSRKESDRVFAAYGDCLVFSQRGQAQAAKFLRMVPNTPAWLAAGRDLATPSCLSRFGDAIKLRFNLVALRPALFAAMYRRRFGKVEPVGLADAPQLSLVSLYDGPVAGFPEAAFTQLSFGNCVVRADALAVHRLLVARPWSSAEDAALPSVTEAMSGCLSTGQTLRLSRSSARGVLAEAMYQISSLRASGARAVGSVK